ncbi:uncharacterized protein J7T54_002857 [Emericellopsis cladophorae]|uniref:Uncharacterized protein n=1 Tax=Emericellopsis cladophorae TaxID=2686198 RepID=A0A9P9XZA2_9HYPO|nr:uncharacterized protein J7T54_002857 [Emericellopsis cladophorae]KAI6780460.1 hypothetical protein J7T54_002857 [Emericellopsis cladophorae]
MEALKKIGRFLAPPPDKGEDGRDQWPSRASFILASMGGAVGMGNMLRFPSQVYNNVGLQWFVPYLLAVFLLAIPALALELAAGNAYRGGCVVAYNSISTRMKGTGMALNYVGLIVVTYFVPILAWIMVYFQNSFSSPLPWEGRGQEYFMYHVVSAVDPVEKNGWITYPGTKLVGDLMGWNTFTWFLVWLCMFRGVGMTGRVVYFTMGLPIITMIIILGRSVSLENAGEGIKLYFGSWFSEKLAGGKIWQDAVGQVFFSTGVGFGYYTAYASYNRAKANTVQDAFIIVCANCLFETIAAFAAFGVVGFLRLWPWENEALGTYSLGFVTYPEAILAMPGANFWAVLFFFTLMLLGVSSSFAMLDAVVTLAMDSELGKKHSRPVVATTIVIVSFLLSIPFCTEFGYWYMDGVDRWINNIGLVFVVWAECTFSTTLYRYKDVVGQVGAPAFYTYNCAYFGSQVLGVAIAHAVMPGVGAGVGFAIFFIGAAIALFISKTPDSPGTPKFWSKNKLSSALFYLAFYSGEQLRLDFNNVVGLGKNWTFPSFWAPLLRYVTGPILAIIFSFAYPSFQTVKNDPVYIFGFVAAHFLLVWVLSGVFYPRWLNVFVPVERRDDGVIPYAPNVPRGVIFGEGSDEAVETGSGTRDYDGKEKKSDSEPIAS